MTRAAKCLVCSTLIELWWSTRIYIIFICGLCIFSKWQPLFSNGGSPFWRWRVCSKCGGKWQATLERICGCLWRILEEYETKKTQTQEFHIWPAMCAALLPSFQSLILSTGAPLKISESISENLQKTSPKFEPVLTFPAKSPAELVFSSGSIHPPRIKIWWQSIANNYDAPPTGVLSLNRISFVRESDCLPLMCLKDTICQVWSSS